MVTVVHVLPSCGAVFLANKVTEKSLTLLLVMASQGEDGRTELEVNSSAVQNESGVISLVTSRILAKVHPDSGLWRSPRILQAVVVGLTGLNQHHGTGMGLYKPQCALWVPLPSRLPGQLLPPGLVLCPVW